VSGEKWAIPCSGLLRDGADPLQEQEAVHIGDDIDQPDPHGSPHDIGSAGKQSYL
jgi:hypothetical protein